MKIVTQTMTLKSSILITAAQRPVTYNISNVNQHIYILTSKDKELLFRRRSSMKVQAEQKEPMTNIKVDEHT